MFCDRQQLVTNDGVRVGQGAMHLVVGLVVGIGSGLQVAAALSVLPCLGDALRTPDLASAGAKLLLTVSTTEPNTRLSSCCKSI